MAGTRGLADELAHTRTIGPNERSPALSECFAAWDLLQHVGPFQLQGAIAAVHAESPAWEGSDWLQISLLYAMLEQAAPRPAVTLNRAVAVSMSLSPEHGLAIVDWLLDDPTMRRHHRTDAVRAHLLEMTGDLCEAVQDYRRAAQLTASLPEQRYLNDRAQRIQVFP